MIETKSLTKRYGDLLAVDNLSFRVEPGQVLGFLGPNGAGKSTTMKMIAGFLSPSAGTVSVCGHDIEAEPMKAKRCIGYLPEGAPAYGEMTPAAFLRFIGEIRGLTPALLEQRIERVISQLHLEKVVAQPIEQLSKGFKRRVGIAQALLHNPQVLVMDEPTDGLDPNQKQEVRELISSMSKDKIIIVSTHILEEVEAVCNRAIIIAQGRILADATPAELATRSRYYQAVTIRSDKAAELKSGLAQLNGVAEVEFDELNGALTAIPRAGAAIFATISEWVRNQSLPIKDMSLERGRLDEVFRSITQAQGARRS